MRLLIFILFPLLSLANWQMGAGSGAYLGAFQLQTQWASPTHRHHIYLSYGYTHDEIVKDIHQYSWAYQWSPRRLAFAHHVWDPLLIGPFITYTDNDHYYFKSPKKYDNEHYYDVNSLRWGLRFSSQITALHWGSRPLHLSLDGSLLEKGLFTYFNNPQELDIFKYFWSLGFSIRMAF